MLGLPDDIDATAVARRELRWWVVRREIGLAAGTAAGEAITGLYAAIYRLPPEAVAEAGRLRGQAAEVRDRGADGGSGWAGGRRPRVLAGGRPAAARLVPVPEERGQRSSGRRPMSHQATGKMPAATASLATSQMRNLVIPSATAVSHGSPRVTLSQGTPIA